MNLARTFEACKIASQPTNFSPEAKSEAEDYLSSFKKSPQPYEACFELLNFKAQNQKDQSAQMLMHFIGVTTLREAILREWQQLDFSKIQAVAEYSFKILPICDRVISNQLTRLLAIIAKREQALNKSTAVLDQLYNTGLEFLKSDDEKQYEMSYLMFNALLCEYSAADSSSNISLTWDKHFECKKSFQTSKLKEIFQMVVAFLSHKFHDKFAELLSTILSWDFVPKIKSKRTIMNNKESDFTPFKPVKCWAPVLFQENVMQSIFKFTIDHPNHTTFTCLQQLASTTGISIFGATKPNQICPKQNFINIFLNLLVQNFSDAKYVKEGNHAYGLSMVVSNIVNQNVRYITKTNCANFADWLLGVSTYIIQMGAKDSGLSYDERQERKFEQAHNEIVKIWYDLNTGMELPIEIIDQIAENMLRGWLAESDGFRPKFSQTAENDQDEDCDDEELNDEVVYNMNFMTLAGMMRNHVERSKTWKYCSILKSMVEPRLKALQVGGNSGNLDDIYEDLHFLVLISGHFLADPAVGETTLPYQFSQFANCDELLSLIQTVANLTEFANTSPISPMLIRDLCWFWERFSKVYLLFWVEGLNKKAPKILQELLSAESNKNQLSEVCQVVFKNVYQLFETCILKYSHEEQVCVSAANMLYNVCSGRPDRIKYLEPLLVGLCHDFSKNIAQTVNAKASNQNSGNQAWHSKLTPTSSRAVISSLIQISFTDLNLTNKYWGCGENSIFHDFSKFLTSFPNQLLSSKNVQSTTISKYLFHFGMVDFLIGCVDSVAPDNVTTIYQLITPFLMNAPEFINRVRAHRETVNLILEFLNSTCYRVSQYLKFKEMATFNECLLKSLQALQGNLATASGREVEEENFQDLIYVMDILDNLLTNGFLDFDDTDANLGISNMEATSIASNCGDTLIYGVSLVIPVMSESLLELPALSDRYYRLLSLLCEIYPEKVLKLTGDQLSSFNYSLQLAMNAGPTSAAQALDAITELAEGIDQSKDPEVKNSPELIKFLESLIKPVFDAALLYSSRAAEIGNGATRAFYAMFKCHDMIASACLQMLTGVVNSVQDENYRKQVENGLGMLVSKMKECIAVTCPSRVAKRNMKQHFMKSFDECVAQIAPIVVVK